MKKQQSPTPNKMRECKSSVEKEKQTTFPEAMTQVIIGKKIRRLEWENKEFYCLLKDGFLMIHKPDGKHCQWILNDGDLLGSDWITLG